MTTPIVTDQIILEMDFADNSPVCCHPCKIPGGDINLDFYDGDLLDTFNRYDGKGYYTWGVSVVNPPGYIVDLSGGIPEKCYENTSFEVWPPRTNLCAVHNYTVPVYKYQDSVVLSINEAKNAWISPTYLYLEIKDSGYDAIVHLPISQGGGTYSRVRDTSTYYFRQWFARCNSNSVGHNDPLTNFVTIGYSSLSVQSIRVNPAWNGTDPDSFYIHMSSDEALAFYNTIVPPNSISYWNLISPPVWSLQQGSHTGFTTNLSCDPFVLIWDQEAGTGPGWGDTYSLTPSHNRKVITITEPS